MDPSFTGAVELLQSGGNIALVVAVYFIYKASHRLARVEKLLEIMAAKADPKAAQALQDANGE